MLKLNNLNERVDAIKKVIIKELIERFISNSLSEVIVSKKKAVSKYLYKSNYAVHPPLVLTT